MFLGEVLRETKEASFNPIKGIRKALDTRKYGSPEERSFAYRSLRSSVSRFFKANSDSAVEFKHNLTKRIMLQWEGYDIGCNLDRNNLGYRLYLKSMPGPIIENSDGEKKQTHNYKAINILTDDISLESWTDITVHKEDNYTQIPGRVDKGRVKTSPLAFADALELAISLHDPEIVKPVSPKQY